MDSVNTYIDKKSKNSLKIIFFALIILFIAFFGVATYYILRYVKSSRTIYLSIERSERTVAMNFIFNNTCNIIPKLPLKTSYTEDSLSLIETGLKSELNEGYACFSDSTVRKIPILIDKKWLTSPGVKHVFIRFDERDNEYELFYDNFKVTLTPIKAKNVMSVNSKENIPTNSPQVLTAYTFDEDLTVVSIEDDLSEVDQNIDYRAAIKKFISNSSHFNEIIDIKYAEEKYDFIKQIQSNDLKSIYIAGCLTNTGNWEYTRDSWLASSTGDRIWPKNLNGLKIIIHQCQGPEVFLNSPLNKSLEINREIRVIDDAPSISKVNLIPDKSELQAMNDKTPITYTHGGKLYTGYALTPETTFYSFDVEEEMYLIDGKINTFERRLLNGVKISKQLFKSGVQNGKSLFWGLGGELLAEENWIDGQLSKRYCWDRNGAEIDCEDYFIGYYLEDFMSYNSKLREKFKKK